MKRLIVSLFVLCMFSQVSLWAADTPKAEIFGGFSVATSKPSGNARTTPVGWQGAIAGSVNDRFSLVGDFGGQYKDGSHIYEYLGGVQMSSRSDTLSYFGHALFGAATFGGGGNPSDTAFMMGYGGGLDVKTSDKVAVRVIQFDWLPSKPSTGWDNNQFRFGIGLVFLSQ